MTCRFGLGIAQVSGFLSRNGAVVGLNLSFAGGQNLNLQQRRTIVSKEQLRLPYDYPDPWPYKERGYSNSMIWVDSTKPRFHVNSKLFVVEGNIASGKTKFASELAEELGFHHMPEFSMEDILIDRYGLDMRDYYHLFPKRFRIPDNYSFYKNPADDQTAVMQDRIFECRWEQFLNALAHIFNTGQGVVLERSPYSDFVFANAMRQKDWISQEYHNYYFYQRKVALPLLQFWPHLVIYLDMPVEQCLENIKKRGNADEINAVDLQYLTTIANSYKDYLQEVRRHSYILTYDWSKSEPMEEVMDDIKRLNFDFYEWHNSDELYEWFSLGDNHNCSCIRHLITDKVQLQCNAFDDIRRLHREVSELYIYPADGWHFRNVMMHEVIKDRCGYGYTHRDPYQGMWNMKDHGHRVPESWTEYYWKEKYYGMESGADRYFDPTAKDYNPEYLSAHH